jgi:hypothetical protein
VQDRISAATASLPQAAQVQGVAVRQKSSLLFGVFDAGVLAIARDFPRPLQHPVIATLVSFDNSNNQSGPLALRLAGASAQHVVGNNSHGA